jgi:hypothetical protein
VSRVAQGFGQRCYIAAALMGWKQTAVLVSGVPDEKRQSFRHVCILLDFGKRGKGERGSVFRIP